MTKKKMTKKKILKKKTSKIFDDQFFSELPKEPAFAALMICERFISFDRQIDARVRKENYETYLELVGCLASFADAHGWKISLPTMDADTDGNIEKVRNLFFNRFIELKKTCAEETIKKAKKHYGPKFDVVVFYEFSDNDFNRVQVLINELRQLISKSQDFEKDHKRRLLKKLENLQGELHKKMSNLDMFWGLVGDAGVALGKFGKNAKPFTDRIGEILQIVCRIQAKAENVKGTLPLHLLTGEQNDPNEKES